MQRKKTYRPLALHLMLKEVEHELRQHGRLKAAIMVRRAAATVAEDIDMDDATTLPEGRRTVLM
jgi:hypothetical protein